MNKSKHTFTTIIKAIGALITVISSIVFKLLLLILEPLSRLIRKTINKIHISLTFKLNFVYGIAYITLFMFSYGIIVEVYIKYINVYVPRAQQASSLKGLGWIVFIISFGIFLTVGEWVTKGVIKSLKGMHETIKQINDTELGQRIDISGTKDELKDLANTFNGMMDTLENYIESQKQFVSNASHELRTPIAVIQGYANLLSRWGKDDKEVLEESIDSIKQEADNMQQLVEKLLFLARADKKTQVVEMETFNLSELTQTTIKHSQHIDSRHVFKTTVDEAIKLKGDKSLIQELLRIFIDNAMKYTPEKGEIEVIAKQSGSNIILGVRDTGCGISKDKIPYIFERFYQVDEARSSEKGSLGLGLSIAKWIVDVHQGKVYVNSLEGIGTEFFVFFNEVEEV